MHIALITDGIHPYVIGGMQKHSFYLAKYLSKHKIYVDLFHYNDSNLNIFDLDVFSDEEKKYIKSTVLQFPKQDNFLGHYIRESKKYSEMVFALVKPQLHTYDFIYTKGFAGWKLIQEKNEGLKCPPIGINFHGYEMYQKPTNFKAIFENIMLKHYAQPLLNKSDYVFSYGGKITQLLIKKANILLKKIIEIPGGIEENWLLETDKEKNPIIHFVFLGRNDKRKGINDLQKTLLKISSDSKFIFTFIGPIPKKKQLNHNNIFYLGEIRDSIELKTKLQQADVLVCPSYSEGMPNVILEAMASKMAIIASNVGAIEKLVSPENGILIKAGNQKQLFNAMSHFIELKSNQLSEMQEKSFLKVKTEFLWNNIISNLIHKINQTK